jgi:hypothetical protein
MQLGGQFSVGGNTQYIEQIIWAQCDTAQDKR